MPVHPHPTLAAFFADLGFLSLALAVPASSASLGTTKKGAQQEVDSQHVPCACNLCYDLHRAGGWARSRGWRDHCCHPLEPTIAEVGFLEHCVHRGMRRQVAGRAAHGRDDLRRGQQRWSVRGHCGAPSPQCSTRTANASGSS